MKKLIMILLLVTAFPALAAAAEVKNLKVGQEGGNAVATYDLVATAGEREAEVTVAIIIDGKRRTADQLNLSGDFGKNVKVGHGKRIVWNATADLPPGFDGELSWDVTAFVSRPVMLPASPGRGPDQVKMGSIDMHKVLLQSNAGKEAKEQLAARAGRYESEKSIREKKLIKLKDELEKLSSLLSKEVRSEKEADYTTQLEELKRFLKEAQDDLQAKNDELTNKIVGEIAEVIKHYGRSNGYEVITAAKENMVYVNENRDVTDLTEEILKAYNATK
jgi:outer membrane protein